MTADTFFAELQKLIILHPKRSNIFSSENCRFGNFLYYDKNLSYCFDCSRSTNGTFLTDSHDCTNCSDCDFTYQTELCYECIDCFQCFNCSYLEYCNNVNDSDFSFDCRSCHDVFGCVRLKNKSFCIFNRQFTETEYNEKVKHLKTLSPIKIATIVNELKLKHPLTQTHQDQNENSSFGNYVFGCKNCYLCFDSEDSENCGYLYDTSKDKFSYDISQCVNIEDSYEVIDCDTIFNSDFVISSKSCTDSSFIFNCTDVNNSLGCMRLEHKKYCILNRQFTKEEYEKISEPLIAEIRSKNYNWKDLVY